MLDGPRWGPKQGQTVLLVVLCHGVGADGHDLITLAPCWTAALPQATFVAPDGPEPNDAALMGRQWFPRGDRIPAQMQAGADAASLLLGNFLDAEMARPGLPGDCGATIWMKVALPRLKCSQVLTRCLI